MRTAWPIPRDGLGGGWNPRASPHDPARQPHRQPTAVPLSRCPLLARVTLLAAIPLATRPGSPRRRPHALPLDHTAPRLLRPARPPDRRRPGHASHALPGFGRTRHRLRLRRGYPASSLASPPCPPARLHHHRPSPDSTIAIVSGESPATASAPQTSSQRSPSTPLPPGA